MRGAAKTNKPINLSAKVKLRMLIKGISSNRASLPPGHSSGGTIMNGMSRKRQRERERERKFTNKKLGRKKKEVELNE
jgi:hypothetical protein